MSDKTISKRSRTDWTKLRKQKDNEIDCADIAPLSKAFFAQATLRLPQPKPSISIRLDPDILDWFKKHGRGYQTRINAVLRMYVEAQRDAARKA
jgi:uncharacterized protein (DUF4415 family)